jgi:cell filamentation protein
MNRNYEYDYEWDSRYCYPKSFVLKNKLAIETPHNCALRKGKSPRSIREARVNAHSPQV